MIHLDIQVAKHLLYHLSTLCVRNRESKSESPLSLSIRLVSLAMQYTFVSVAREFKPSVILDRLKLERGKRKGKVVERSREEHRRG